MQKKHLICTFVIIADTIVTVLTAGPSWNTPSYTTLPQTSSECGTGITSLDASSTDGSSVLYSIVSQDPNGNFDVVDNPSPPFEKQLRCTEASITVTSYSVTVRATHSGGNKEHTDLTLTIHFTDVVPDLSGEAPVFVNPDTNSWIIDVLETIQAGDTILTLSATDADSDDSTLTFNMAASPSATTALFEITGNLLKVKAGVATDYFDVEDVSTVTQFRINLEVSDKSSSTTLEAVINIQDVNDNPPVFSGPISATIGENVPEGYTVFTVTATDNDKTTANNQVTLSLADISEFHLEGNDIKVSAGTYFDAITKSSYQLTITASDNVPGDPKTTSQVYDVSIKADEASKPNFFIEGHRKQTDVTVDENDGVIQFICEVDSNQSSTFKILFNGVVLDLRSNTKQLSMILSSVACLDGGEYTCERNDEPNGRSSRKSINLYVNCSPRPLHKMKQNITSPLNVPVTLSFTALAYPYPGSKGFVWFKEHDVDWLPVLSNADLHIYSSALQSNLTILNVSNTDYGRYRLTVTNDHDSFVQYVFLEKDVTENEESSDICQKCRAEETGNAELITSISLGVAFAVLAIYAVSITILYKRKTEHKDKLVDVKETTHRTYANIAYKSNEQDNENNDGTTAAEGNEARQYTDLVGYSHEDKTTYEVLQDI